MNAFTVFSVKTLQHSLQCSTYTQAITIELRRILTAILAYILNI